VTNFIRYTFDEWYKDAAMGAFRLRGSVVPLIRLEGFFDLSIAVTIVDKRCSQVLKFFRQGGRLRYCFCAVD
jgi:hypothetical protein